MKRPLAVLICFSIALLMGADEPKEFSPTNGGFTIKMPGEPKLIEKDANGVKFKIWAIEQKDVAFLVTTNDVPGSATESDEALQTRLDNGRDGFINGGNRKLIKETKIVLDEKYPGRDVIGTVPGTTSIIRDRFYLVKGRMYQVMIVGSKEFHDSDEAKDFFNSFKLVK